MNIGEIEKLLANLYDEKKICYIRKKFKTIFKSLISILKSPYSH